MQDDTGALARALERPDGVQLYVRDYVVHAGVQAKALVVIIHGGGWHSAYFKPVADHFNRKGACGLWPTLRTADLGYPFLRTPAWPGARRTCSWLPQQHAESVPAGVPLHASYAVLPREVDAAITRAGLVVVTYDQRGHGRSGQVDGVRAYCNSAYDHTEDLLAVLQHAQAQHVGLPCYLMSESAGGARSSPVLPRVCDRCDHSLYDAAQAVARSVSRGS